MILQKIALKAQSYGETEDGWRRVGHSLCFLRGFGFFDERFLTNNDDNSRVGHMEPPPVGLGVKADLRAFRQVDVTVNNRASYSRVPADIHVIVDDGIGHFRVAIHPDVVPNYTALHPSTGNHRAARYDGIERHAHAFRI